MWLLELEEDALTVVLNLDCTLESLGRALTTTDAWVPSPKFLIYGFGVLPGHHNLSSSAGDFNVRLHLSTLIWNFLVYHRRC